MCATFRKKLTDDEGFTLVELLTIILIVGVLAAIAIPVLLSQRGKASEAGIKSDLRIISTQMETYYADNQTYPAVDGNTPGQITIGAETYYLSTGNVAATTTDDAFVSSSGYCVGVYNANAGGASGAIYFNSLKGGMQAKGAGCGA